MTKISNNISIDFLDFIKNYKIKEQKRIFRHTEKINEQLKSNQEWSKEKREIIRTIENQYSIDFFPKIRKYKILYFLYGGFIYIHKNLLKEENLKSFFLNETDNYWSAFQQGPILKSTYIYLNHDLPIYLNFDKFSQEEKEFLRRATDILLSMSIDDLVKESHKTLPWINNFRQSYYDEIPIKEIIAYFEEHPPFFIGTNIL